MLRRFGSFAAISFGRDGDKPQSDGITETRKFEGEMKPLMSEEEKKDAQVLELSYDFSCRIIRLYKYLNEGKLSKLSQ